MLGFAPAYKNAVATGVELAVRLEQLAAKTWIALKSGWSFHVLPSDLEKVGDKISKQACNDCPARDSRKRPWTSWTTSPAGEGECGHQPENSHAEVTDHAPRDQPLLRFRALSDKSRAGCQAQAVASHLKM